MSPSENSENPRRNKTPQIGRREVGAFLLLLAINWTLVLLFFGASARHQVTIPYSPTFLAQVQAGVPQSTSPRPALAPV